MTKQTTFLSLGIVFSTILTFSSLSHGADKLVRETATYKVMARDLDSKSGTLSVSYIVLKTTKSGAQKVNQLMLANIPSEACRDSGDDKSEEIHNSDVLFLNDQILSLIQESEYNCAGAAYPDHSQQYVSYDLTTGKELKLEDIFKIEKKSNSQSELNQKFMGEQISSLATAIAVSSSDFDSECKDAYAEPLSIDSIGILENGFVVTPEMPHAVQACAQEVTITYNLVRGLLKPGPVSQLAERLQK